VVHSPCSTGSRYPSLTNRSSLSQAHCLADSVGEQGSGNAITERSFSTLPADFLQVASLDGSSWAVTRVSKYTRESIAARQIFVPILRSDTLRSDEQPVWIMLVLDTFKSRIVSQKRSLAS